MKVPDPATLITVSAAAKRAKVTPRAIYVALERGEFTEHWLADRRVIDPAELAAWIRKPTRQRTLGK